MSCSVTVVHRCLMWRVVGLPHCLVFFLSRSAVHWLLSSPSVLAPPIREPRTWLNAVFNADGNLSMGGVLWREHRNPRAAWLQLSGYIVRCWYKGVFLRGDCASQASSATGLYSAWRVSLSGTQGSCASSPVSGFDLRRYLVCVTEHRNRPSYCYSGVIDAAGFRE